MPINADVVVANPGLGAGQTSLVTFTFSEAVSGFTTADLTVGSGVVSGLTTGDGGVTWTATLTPDLGVEAPGNFIVLDLAGVLDGGLVAGSGTVYSNPYVVDTAGPTSMGTTIAIADTNLAAGATSTVTITFSEPVTDFTLADLSAGGGALSGLSTSDNITYTATFTAGPTGSPSNVITLDNTGVTDLAGNAGAGTTDSNNYAVNAGGPTVDSFVVADTTLAAGETSLVTITFSEAVTGFTNADLTVQGGTLSAVSSSDGGVTWTATLTPTASFADASNVITLDNTGVANLSATPGSGTTDSNNYAVDTVRPTATIVVADTSLAAGETSGVTITFSEAVTGFTNADLTVAGGTLSAVSSSDGGVTWTATLTPTASLADATNLITLDNTGVADAAGNAGTGTTDSNNYAINTVRPTAAIVVADATLAAGGTSGVTITFSEAVTGFTNADLTVAGGTLSAVSSSDGGVTWTATLTPTASLTDASNVITLDNTGVVNAAGNAGSGTTDSNNYAIDTARPTAGIVVADATLAIGETSAVTITFSEAVTGFTNADLTVQGGTLSAVSSSDGGVTWTATLTPTASLADATNLITLDNTGVADAAGNAGSGTTDSSNYAVDTVRPTVASIVLADASLTTGETSLVTFTFSEAVTGFTNADLTVEGGTLSTVSSADGGLTWTATLTPSAPLDDATNVITLANTGVTDLAGNAATGTSASGNYTIVTAAPSPPPSPPAPSPITISSGSVVLTNGTESGDTFILSGGGIGGGLGGPTIVAGGGNDLVTISGASSPFIGQCTVFGGTGLDTIIASTGNDFLQGNQGSDSIIGGGGNDLVRGGADNDFVQGNIGNDLLFGDAGADILFGGQGADTIQGNAGSDTILGNVGDDVIRGGQGDDVIAGDAGADDLWGDAGSDTMFGGAGADRFHCGATGADIIGDFSIADGDKVVLDAGTHYTLKDLGAYTLIEIAGGGQVMLAGVKLSSLTGDWLVA